VRYDIIEQLEQQFKQLPQKNRVKCWILLRSCDNDWHLLRQSRAHFATILRLVRGAIAILMRYIINRICARNGMVANERCL